MDLQEERAEALCSFQRSWNYVWHFRATDPLINPTPVAQFKGNRATAQEKHNCPHYAPECGCWTPPSSTAWAWANPTSSGLTSQTVSSLRRAGHKQALLPWLIVHGHLWAGCPIPKGLAVLCSRANISRSSHWALYLTLWETERAVSWKVSVTPSQFLSSCHFTGCCLPPWAVETAGEKTYLHPAAWLIHGQQIARGTSNTQAGQTIPSEESTARPQRSLQLTPCCNPGNISNETTLACVNTSLTKAWFRSSCRSGGFLYTCIVWAGCSNPTSAALTQSS